MNMDHITARILEEQQDERSQIKILDEKFDNRRSIIRICDFARLSRGIFMNDTLIEFYMNYMYSKLSDEDKDRTYVFNTYFYSTLTKPFNNLAYPSLSQSEIRHNRVKKWTKNVDVFKKDFIFIPINKCKHWFLAVICFPYLSGKVDMRNGTPVNEPDDDTGRYPVPPIVPLNPQYDEADLNVEDLWMFNLNYKDYQYKHGVNYFTDVEKVKNKKHSLVKRPCILIFDSLYGGEHSALVTATLREWLHDEYCTKYNGEKKDFSVMKACLVKVPQQPNQTDCGLFMIHYFQMFYCKPIIDYTFPIGHLENWFHADDVVKNGKKRREIYNILMERIRVQGSILPSDVALPVLQFNDHNEVSEDEEAMEEYNEDEVEDEDDEEEEEDDDFDYDDDVFDFDDDYDDDDVDIDYDDDDDDDDDDDVDIDYDNDDDDEYNNYEMEYTLDENENEGHQESDNII